MTVKELKSFLEDYQDEQFIGIRIWFSDSDNEIKKDISIISEDSIDITENGTLLIVGEIKL